MRLRNSTVRRSFCLYGAGSQTYFDPQKDIVVGMGSTVSPNATNNAFAHQRPAFMAMPEELQVPFPMSPSAIPMIPGDTLLNDVEQKYFSEFLDTFWGPDDATTAMTMSHHQFPGFDPLTGTMDATAMYMDQRLPQHHHSYGAPGAPSAPPNAMTQSWEGSGGNSQRMMSSGNSVSMPGPTPAPLYIQTSRPMPPSSAPPNSMPRSKSGKTRVSADQQPSSHAESSPPHLITGESANSAEVANSPSPSPTEPSNNQTGSSSDAAAASSSTTSGKATKKGVGGSRAARVSKDTKRRNGRELLTEQEKRTNHIVSEQKRRTLIRSGFKALADLVPGATGGNLGTSKSVILHNAVGFIRHLEYGNRTLADQLDRLHKRYEMKLAAGRGSVAPTSNVSPNTVLPQHIPHHPHHQPHHQLHQPPLHQQQFQQPPQTHVLRPNHPGRSSPIPSHAGPSRPHNTLPPSSSHSDGQSRHLVMDSGDHTSPHNNKQQQQQHPQEQLLKNHLHHTQSRHQPQLHQPQTQQPPQQSALGPIYVDVVPPPAPERDPDFGPPRSEPHQSMSPAQP
ncbi:hypothetical protein DFJ77DRAFT_466499 [Powellomyces hirtus]|nr:hypothetical protein DFJ77DRAFT_466499 [Powellomyces hirtus]